MARILIIEDNQANLDLAQYLLEHHGHHVLPATDGEMGVQMARGERPELILCDLQMPLLDGYGVLERLRRDDTLAGTPIIAVTAFSMAGDEEKVRRAGFDGYFSKPIEPETFVSRVEAFLPARARGG